MNEGIFEPAPNQFERKKGRYKLCDEEKAKQLTIRLHKEHLEKLDFVKGDSNADKIRFLLDRYIVYEQRERRQASILREKIAIAYLRMKKATEPTEDKMEKDQRIEKFREAIGEVEGLSNLFHFSIDDLKRVLTQDNFHELSMIFSFKGFIDQE